MAAWLELKDGKKIGIPVSHLFLEHSLIPTSKLISYISKEHGYESQLQCFFDEAELDGDDMISKEALPLIVFKEKEDRYVYHFRPMAGDSVDVTTNSEVTKSELYAIVSHFHEIDKVRLIYNGKISPPDSQEIVKSESTIHVVLRVKPDESVNNLPIEFNKIAISRDARYADGKPLAKPLDKMFYIETNGKSDHFLLRKDSDYRLYLKKLLTNRVTQFVDEIYMDNVEFDTVTIDLATKHKN